MPSWVEDAYPNVESTMCAHTRSKEVNPVSRWVRTIASWPKAFSRNGTRAMRMTWMSRRFEASSAVSRPNECSAPVTDPSSPGP